jgi:uncharacterized membrane protein YkoI
VNTRRTAFAALTVPLALTLVACGGDDDADDRAEMQLEQTATSSDPVPTPTDAATPAAPAGDDTAVLAAATTAAGAVDGGTLFALDLEAGGWDAEVVDAGATAYDLALAADGSSVTREPVEDRDDADDTDDRTEREQLLADATLDAAGAVAAARGAVPAGTVTGLDLDLSAGTAVWEVQLDEDTATEQTVTVDAVSGEVLRTEQDD